MKAVTSILAGAAMLLGAAGAQAEVIYTDNTYLGLDNSSAAITFDVKQHGSISDLNIAVTFSKCDNPYIDPAGTSCIGRGTPYENEIVMRLVGPNGKQLSLVEANTFERGDVGIGRVLLTFDDEGAVLGKRVQGGSFRPLQVLSAFDGIDMFGQWQVYFQDTAGSDPLEVFSTSLVFNATEVPEPASLAVFGTGLFALGALRRRQRRQR